MKLGTYLVNPEDGWKRFYHDNKNISYLNKLFDYYKDYYHTYMPAKDCKFCFNFTGTKIRLLFEANTNGNYSRMNIKLDNKDIGDYKTSYPINYPNIPPRNC